MEERSLNNVSFSAKLKRFPQLTILIAFIALFLVFAFATDTFLTPGNMMNVFRQAAPNLIVAIGMTFVLILGEIALSVGSVACMSGILAGGFMVNQGMPWVLGMVCGIALGTLMGFINGILVAKVKMPSFIATLAMMSTARGIALVYTGGYPVSGIPDEALNIGRGYVGELPIPVIIMLVIVVLAWILLSRTKFGRYVYATGSNSECARLSGVKIGTIKILVFTLCGLFASITGFVMAMRLGSGQPTMADGLEMDAITMAVLGGTSLSGGRGFMLGTIIGCMFMTVLSNGFNIIGVSSFWQQVLTGIILVAAVCMYGRMNKGKV